MDKQNETQKNLKKTHTQKHSMETLNTITIVEER